MTHEATYSQNRFTPSMWRVKCSCGWWYIGNREECETRFSGHDLGPEWIDVPRKAEWQRRLDEIKGR